MFAIARRHGTNLRGTTEEGNPNVITLRSNTNTNTRHDTVAYITIRAWGLEAIELSFSPRPALVEHQKAASPVFDVSIASTTNSCM